MALQRAKLADIATVAASPASVYTNTPAGTKTYIKGIVLHNTNTTAETVKVYSVPDNGSGGTGSAAATNRVLNVSLPANDTLIVEFPSALVLTDNGDSLQAETSTASKVTITVLGDKE
jgi:hypothetical protein